MDEERAVIDQILAMLVQMAEDGEEISPDLEEQLSGLINNYADRLESQEQRPIQPNIPPGAEQLWVLAGGNPQAFEQYLQTVPNPQLNALLRNPAQLEEVIGQLGNRITTPHGEVADGIPKAPLQSSNVYGFSYDPRSSNMFVRFNSGSVYQYNQVPPQVFKAFMRFGTPAKTTGNNQYGRWWVGKSPSMGATFYDIIRNGPFQYQRVA